MRPAAALPLKKVCPLEGDLPGTGAVRHCPSCATDVVDLSLLTAADADRMLANPARPKCVSYQVDDDGNVIHLAPPPARRRLPILAAGLLLAACNGSTVDGTGPSPTPVAETAAAASSSAAIPAPAPAASAAPEPTEKHTRGELAAPTPAASGDSAAGCNPDEGAMAANDKQGNPAQPSVPAPKKPKKPKHPTMRGYM